MGSQTEPRLSIVFAATHDSPALHTAVERHLEQLAQADGELLVADGSLDGLPEEIPVAVQIPGADVFELRAAAVEIARGWVVAITEDHCIPETDWHSATLRAHEEHPDTAAVGGTTLNGSRERALDWANFLVTFATFLPPLPLRHPTRSSPPVNISIKRESLSEFELVPGRLEMEIIPNMYRVGQLVLDERVRVTHIQSHSLRRTVAAHFHNGRSTASLPFRRPPARELARRSAHSLILPALLLTDTMRTLRHKPGYRRVAVRAFPFMVVLTCSHATGELVGTLFGPGTSPERLE